MSLRRSARIAVSVAAVAMAAACGGGEPRIASPSASPSPSARPAEIPAPGDHTLTLDWQGQERRYLLHAPPTYAPGGAAVPLVVVMHGYPSAPGDIRDTTGMNAVADAKGFLVAYPQGVSGGYNALICCGDLDDVGFIRTLVEHLVSVWHVDAARAYATGFSNGADMSLRLAVEASATFAAVAPVSGGFVGHKATSDETFKPSRPVSVITFYGSQDRNVTGLAAGMRTWRKRVGCPERAMSRCRDGSDVHEYVVNGMGHTWPDPTTLNAAALIWDFFAAHPRR